MPGAAWESLTTNRDALDFSAYVAAYAKALSTPLRDLGPTAAAGTRTVDRRAGGSTAHFGDLQEGQQW